MITRRMSISGERSFERRSHALEFDARSIEEEELARHEELARVYRCERTPAPRAEPLPHSDAQLLRAVECASAPTPRCSTHQMRKQYRYILVDEFQDTNIAQLELLWLPRGPTRQHRGRRRPPPGHLSFPPTERRTAGVSRSSSERFLRHRRTESGTRHEEVSGLAFRELSLDKTHSERGLRSGDRTQRTIPLVCRPIHCERKIATAKKIRVVEFGRPEEGSILGERRKSSACTMPAQPGCSFCGALSPALRTARCKVP